MRSIPEDLAFSKGVDYFTEIIFFYMAMFGIAFYEMNKAHKSTLRTAKRLDTATENSDKYKT